MRNSCLLCSCTIARYFSQIRNLQVGYSSKYSCAKMRMGLAYNYFRRVYFFFAPIMLDMFQDIADRWLLEEWVLGSRLCCVIGLTRKKTELRRGDIDFRCADSLGLFNIFSQMNNWADGSLWALIFLVCEFYFKVLQAWVMYDTVLGNTPDIISD